MQSSCSTSYQFADPVEYRVDVLLSNGVVTTGIVIGGILLPWDQLLGVKKLAVRACTNLI